MLSKYGLEKNTQRGMFKLSISDKSISFLTTIVLLSLCIQCLSLNLPSYSEFNSSLTMPESVDQENYNIEIDRNSDDAPDLNQNKQVGSRGDTSPSTRGLSVIWSDTFEGGTFLKWDNTNPNSDEIRIMQGGSSNFAGKVVQARNIDSQKFVEGRDRDNQTNVIEKTFSNLVDFTKMKLEFYWAEQDVETNEICNIKLFDKQNGYQIIKTIGTDNGNNDGIQMGEWNHAQFDLYDLTSLGLNEISDWSEVRLRFEWQTELGGDAEAVDDQWFLDDVTLWGDAHPKLMGGIVTPNVGDITDTYEFSVTYLDADNDMHFFVNLNLNGTDHEMLEVDPDDETYSNGKSFTYSISLVSDTTYTYYFSTSDGTTVINTDPVMGPIVNRGPPAQIVVQADKTQITTDETIQFSATGYDAHNSYVTFAHNWSVNGGGYISNTGFFTATTIGSWRAFANYSGKGGPVSGYIDFKVNAGKLRNLIIQSNITTNPPVITADELVSFEAIGIDADNNIIPLDIYNPKWSLSGGGALDLNGTFDPQVKGQWTIFVNATVDMKEISAEFNFQIIHGVGKKLEIVPPEKQISAGDTVTFTLNAIDSDGNKFVATTANWSVSGGGTIDKSGKLKAKTIGGYNVSATYTNEINQTISTINGFNVELGPIKSIKVIPEDVVLAVHGTQDFHAMVYDDYGNSVIVVPIWNISGGGDFDIDSGTFTADTAGIWRLDGNYNGFSANSTIYINEYPVKTIKVKPNNELLIVDDELKFSAEGFDAAGNKLFIDPVWSVSGGGHIDHNGNFISEENGIWTVYANFSGRAGFTNVIVNNYPLYRIAVIPDSITLNANEPYQFEARGFTTTDLEVLIKPVWAVYGTGTDVFIDQNGLFLANESGTWKVSATQGSISGTAEVTIISDKPTNGKDTSTAEGSIPRKVRILKSSFYH
jgi:plastocyanin